MDRIPSNNFRNAWLSLLIPLVIVGVFAINSRSLLHWFLFPLILCGFLVFDEFLRWNGKRINIFAPSALVSIVAIPFFFLNPLLHVFWDYWMKYVIHPPDWRPWLGGMAILNAAGIIAYKISRNFFSNIFKNKRKRVVWLINEERLRIGLLIAMCISILLQLRIFIRFGGIGGYISAYENRTEAFSGMGTIFVFSESFPILLAIFLILWMKKKRARQNEFSLLALIIVFLGLQLLFGGLRGSRGVVLYSAFWIVGIIHFYLKPFSNRKLLAFAIAAFIFVYSYGFYKSTGSSWISVLSEEGVSAGLNTLEEETGRTLKAMILGDFGRSDVQSFLLYRTWEYPGEYRYAYGKTYIEDLAQLLPQWILEDQPIGKILWGTDILRGSGAWSPKPGHFAQNAYGLGGEAILNFGPIAVPFFYVLLGLIVARITFMAQAVNHSLINTILFPLFLEVCVWILLWDFGNLVYFLIHNGLFPIIVLLFSLQARQVFVRTDKTRFIEIDKTLMTPEGMAKTPRLVVKG